MFPPLVEQLPEDTFFSKEKMLGMMIDVRMVKHFLQFWGFAVSDKPQFVQDELLPGDVRLLPLWHQTFVFEV